MKTIEEEVAGLLRCVPSPPGEAIPPGASDEVIAAFERRCGVAVPSELRQWLKTSNGPCVGPGGLFGIRPLREDLDIELHWRLYPMWKEKQLIAVAGDGNGNYYVLDANQRTTGGHPVTFIDTMEDPARPLYVVASGLWKFLYFLLAKELRPSPWPFDRRFMQREDPEIVSFSEYTMPWEA
jgi:hypothetical protein